MPRLIDADALYDVVMDSIKPMTKNEAIILQDFIALVEDAPTVDAEPIRHGHWINHHDDLFPEESTQECSVCHAEQMATMLNDNYCPNCGAKMDEANDDV